MAIVVDIEFRLGSTTVSESAAGYCFTHVIPLRVICGVGWTE